MFFKPRALRIYHRGVTSSGPDSVLCDSFLSTGGCSYQLRVTSAGYGSATVPALSTDYNTRVLDYGADYTPIELSATGRRPIPVSYAI